MTEKRIVYVEGGAVRVLIPPREFIDAVFAGDVDRALLAIAAKDVPAGLPFRIVDAADLPVDRGDRELWTVDAADLTDGVGGDYGAGTSRVVIGWTEAGEPVIQEVAT
ncbi:hypothetical protein CCR97_30365 [Rhodoplanes elegans]|uniref:Uncharacterized protein n=1 Tax=Rhodoplanes elegans TaxID=29408 RepID=A0A327JVC8_9BRAD|nr:hypothetical protein [Rhodoplanes elegans]MBK5962462.1 hypothetical protein [Rhodoplanes elegans]RAI28872.1 hypothetical protein CH338_29055 [Rhodoplanes elegans]